MKNSKRKTPVPYEKLSPKAKKAEAAKRRSTWGSLNPTTRCPDNSAAYKRNKQRAADRKEIDRCL